MERKPYPHLTAKARSPDGQCGSHSPAGTEPPSHFTAACVPSNDSHSRGPGLEPGNGNFILSEFQLDVTPIPEPGLGSLLLLGGLLGLSQVRWAALI